MLVHHRVARFVTARPIKLIKAVLVLREVRAHPVDDDADAGLVALVHEIHKILRRTVARARRVVPRYLIAPRRVKRIFRNGQKLDVRVVHIADVFHDPVGKGAVGKVVSVLIFLP